MRYFQTNVECAGKGAKEKFCNLYRMVYFCVVKEDKIISKAERTRQFIIEKTAPIAGIRKERIFFLGFSQGACLTLEFVARHAARYGGVAAFTGGLIGDKIYTENYKGNFDGMPVFIGTGDHDPHVPLQRVQATTALLRELHADVTERVYPGRPHTILGDEMAEAARVVFGGGAS
jgi:predicted esterase